MFSVIYGSSISQVFWLGFEKGIIMTRFQNLVVLRVSALFMKYLFQVLEIFDVYTIVSNVVRAVQDGCAHLSSDVYYIRSSETFLFMNLFLNQIICLLNSLVLDELTFINLFKSFFIAFVSDNSCITFNPRPTVLLRPNVCLQYGC